MTRNEIDFLKSKPWLVEAPRHFELAFVPFLTVSGKKPHHSIFTFVQAFTFRYNGPEHVTISLSHNGMQASACSPHNSQVRGDIMCHAGPHKSHHTQE